MKKLIPISILVVVSISLIFFQNCIEQQGLHSRKSSLSNPSSETRRESNGTGYSGILSLQTPKEVMEGTKTTIRVSGGTQPYTVSVSNPQITVVDLGDGLYELVIPPDQSGYEFTVQATDAANDQASSVIRVIGGTDFYNMGSASALYLDAQGGIGFDAQTGKMNYFNPDGTFTDFSLDFQPPNADWNYPLYYRYVSHIQFHRGTTYVLDQVMESVLIYENRFSHTRRLYVTNEGGFHEPSGLSLHGDHMLVTDKRDNSLWKYDLSGDLVSQRDLLDLDTGAVVRGVVHKSNGDFYILDGVNHVVHLYDGNFDHQEALTLSAAPGDEAFEYINLMLAPNGEDLYLTRVRQDSGAPMDFEVMLTGNQPFTGTQQTVQMTLAGEGLSDLTLVYGKSISNMYRPSFCLGYDTKMQLMVCNEKNGAIAINEAGEELEAYNNGGDDNELPSPGAMIVTDGGDIAAISNIKTIRVFGPDYKLKDLIQSVPGKLSVNWVDLLYHQQKVIAVSDDGFLHTFHGTTFEHESSLELKFSADENVLPMAVEFYQSHIYVLNSEYGLSRFTAAGQFVEHYDHGHYFSSDDGDGSIFEAYHFGIGATGKIFVSMPPVGGIFSIDDFQSEPDYHNIDTKPSYLTVMGEDTVYIAERHDGRLLGFNMTDGFSIAFDPSGSVNKAFQDPSSVVFKNNQFYVADAVKNSIVIIPYTPPAANP